MISLLVLVNTAEAKKPKAPPPPPVGWHHEEGWAGDCYYPPDFTKLAEGDRKMARQTALEEMKKQWLGQKDDGVKMDDTVVDNLETTLLGRPTAIEGVAAGNRDQCIALRKAAGGGGGGIDAWTSYVSGLPAKLTAGECTTPPLTYTVFDYLDIGNGWQRPIGLCKGDVAHIIATAKDKYRISETGPWINVEGDPSQKAAETYPCNIEGCNVGMLVGKFTTDAGVETVFPIGAEHTFKAPENGTLTYSINDTAWYDNRWFKTGAIEDHTGVTVEPGE